MAMKTALREMDGFQEILERKEADLFHILRRRDGIAIEKSADQMDEIQYAVSFRQACVKVDIGAGIRIIGVGREGLCASCT